MIRRIQILQDGKLHPDPAMFAHKFNRWKVGRIYSKKKPARNEGIKESDQSNSGFATTQGDCLRPCVR
jgi:hypothetical protein